VVETIAERAALTKEFVIAGLMEIVERTMQHRPVLDAFGNPVVVETPNGDLAAAYRFDPKNAKAAYELLGKELGMFVERKDIRSPAPRRYERGRTACPPPRA
jgi:phage terminase small subunit